MESLRISSTNPDTSRDSYNLLELLEIEVFMILSFLFIPSNVLVIVVMKSWTTVSSPSDTAR